MERTVIEEQISGALAGLTPEQKYELGSRCYVCDGASFVKCGHTAAGTQRFKCSECGSILCHIQTGSVLMNTKLDHAVWKRYVPLFINYIPSRMVAEKLGVSTQTA